MLKWKRIIPLFPNPRPATIHFDAKVEKVKVLKAKNYLTDCQTAADMKHPKLRTPQQLHIPHLILCRVLLVSVHIIPMTHLKLSEQHLAPCALDKFRGG